MDEVGTIAVWNALKEFGFSPDPKVISDDMPGLSLDFGNFKLEASTKVSNWYSPDVFVHFGGIRATPRAFAKVSFKLPRIVDSRQQLAAFLVHYLDSQANGDQRVFHPAREVDWISEGRQNRHLLPWEVDKSTYQARPHCSVQQNWLRLGLKNLAELLTNADDTAAVEISFDGSVLLIKCSDKVVAVSAHGNPWNTLFTIPAGKLSHLPKRLAKDEIEVSVRSGRLYIGRTSFDGAKEKMR